MGIWRGLSGVIFPTSWNFLGNHDDNNRSGDTAPLYHDDLGLFGDLAWVIWGYLGIWRGLSRAIWGFARVIWGYFSHFLEFFGES